MTNVQLGAGAIDVPDTVGVSLWYPRQGPAKYIDVELVDVRTNDGIRLSYDFERDGWVVEQPRADRYGCYESWVEVAFLAAWALEEEGDGEL